MIPINYILLFIIIDQQNIDKSKCTGWEFLLSLLSFSLLAFLFHIFLYFPPIALFFLFSAVRGGVPPVATFFILSHTFFRLYGVEFLPSLLFLFYLSLSFGCTGWSSSRRYFFFILSHTFFRLYGVEFLPSLLFLFCIVLL